MSIASSPNSTFRYTALRIDGSTVEGNVTAASDSHATESLLRSGLYVATIQRVTQNRPTRSRVSLDDHATALRTFAELLNAGLPPLRALQLLRETAPASWVEGLRDICISVEQGSSVATAFRDSSLGLPPLVDGLFRAGEAGMGLATAAAQAADLLGRRAALHQSLASALAYPAVLLVTGGASVALLVMVVLPKFAVILRGLGSALPLSTRIILGVGDAVRSLGPVAAVTSIIAVLAFRAWQSTDDGAMQWSEILLRVPVSGRITQGLSASQAMHALGSLLNSGVPISTALEYAASAAGNRAIGARLLKCRDDVRSGRSLSAALLSNRTVPIPIIRLARAGEETGRLAEMLSHGAAIEHRWAEQRISAVVRLIEPVLILTFGATIAVVASALFQAMYAVRPGV